MTMRERFSQCRVVRVREPALFLRENVVAVVILLRVLARFEIVVETDTSYHDQIHSFIIL